MVQDIQIGLRNSNAATPNKDEEGNLDDDSGPDNISQNISVNNRMSSFVSDRGHRDQVKASPRSARSHALYIAAQE